jgi:hypothetical protein
MNNRDIKGCICSMLFLIAIVSIFFTILLPKEHIKTTCIVENKYNETYACENGKYACGPTINYKIGYYLTETSTGISKWACDTRKPICSCCNRKNCRNVVTNEKKIFGECYPIITTELDDFQRILNGSTVVCWIDPDDNYLMQDQKRGYDGLTKIVLCIILVLLCGFLCGFLCILLEQWYKDSYKNKIGNIVLETNEIDSSVVDYNAMAVYS